MTLAHTFKDLRDHFSPCSGTPSSKFLLLVVVRSEEGFCARLILTDFKIVVHLLKRFTVLFVNQASAVLNFVN